MVVGIAPFFPSIESVLLAVSLILPYFHWVSLALRKKKEFGRKLRKNVQKSGFCGEKRTFVASLR